jgi:hypothetical protein
VNPLWVLVVILALFALALTILAWRRVGAVRARDTVWTTLMSKTPFELEPFDARMLDALPEPARRHLTFALGSSTALHPVVVVETSSSAPEAEQAHTIMAAPFGWLSRRYGRGFSSEVGIFEAERFSRRWWGRVFPAPSRDGDDLLARAALETALWAPACLRDARWTPLGDDTVRLHLTLAGHDCAVDFDVSPSGALTRLTADTAGLVALPGKPAANHGLMLPHEVRFEGPSGTETVSLVGLRLVPAYRGHSHT